MIECVELCHVLIDFCENHFLYVKAGVDEDPYEFIVLRKVGYMVVLMNF